MKTVLLISSERAAAAVSDLYTFDGVRVITRPAVTDAASAISAGVFELAVVIVETWTETSAREIQSLRRLGARLPVLVAVDAAETGPAYASGADAVVPWPQGSALVRTLVGRWLNHGAMSDRTAVAGRGPALATSLPTAAVQSPSPLEVLRDFAKILSHSLDERSFAQRLVEQLAEILGVVRIALFLEPDAQLQPVVPEQGDPRLVCAAAVGIPPDIVACFELSRGTGLGRCITQRPGVVSKHSLQQQLEFDADGRVVQEFDVLGCEMALPIRDRDRVIGVAVFGDRITGGPFTTEELNLGYFLMGELGMAIRNSRLHRGLTVNHELLSRVLETMTSGSLVIGPDLRVLHANRAAGSLLGLAEGRSPATGDLPVAVRQALSGNIAGEATVRPIFDERRGGSARLLRFSIIPLHGDDSGGGPRLVMVLIDDWTQIDAAKQADIESANAQLITTIAARFAHEIRNSLVPLSTHAQLFATQGREPAFLDSLRVALQRETLRIRRLSDQMLFLAGSDAAREEQVSAGELVRSAFGRAQEIVSKTGELIVDGDAETRVRCTRESITYALQEILANALQSVAGTSKIRVKVMPTTRRGKQAVAIGITDSGSGFTAETAARAVEPFYTTRTTGVGLGLAVARRIIVQHAGELLIYPRGMPDQPDVQVILPAP